MSIYDVNNRREEHPLRSMQALTTTARIREFVDHLVAVYQEMVRTVRTVLSSSSSRGGAGICTRFARCSCRCVWVCVGMSMWERFPRELSFLIHLLR